MSTQLFPEGKNQQEFLEFKERKEGKQVRRRRQNTYPEFRFSSFFKNGKGPVAKAAAAGKIVLVVPTA